MITSSFTCNVFATSYCKITKNSIGLRKRSEIRTVGFLFFVISIFSSLFTMGQYQSGKLAVVVVGNGTSSLSGAAAPVFIKEFNIIGASQSGVIRTSLPTLSMSSTFSVDRALTQSGTGTSEGALNLSTNKQFLITTGYNVSAGTGAVATLVASPFPTNTRVIAKIGANGIADTKTTLNTSYSTVAIRSATSVDGSTFWTAGANANYYTASGSIAAPNTLSATNTRVVGIFNGQLYSSSQSGSLRLATVGTNLPVTGTQTLTNLSGFLTSTGDPYSFSFLDLNNNGNPDVLYVASLGSAPTGLLKYTSADGGLTWTARGSLTGNAFGVTAVLNCAGSVDLYVTSSTGNVKPTLLYKFTDAAGSGNITSSGSALSAVGTLLATALTNTVFGGVAFTPGSSFSVPTAYTMTGGGAVCATGTGVAVGLSNSQTGISYQLFNGATAVGTAVSGTGSSISFGNQSTAATYTVVGTNLLTGCTTNMLGNAVVTSVAEGTWTGLVSSDWYDAGNWCGDIPTSSTNVIIPASTLHQLSITSTIMCESMTIQAGAIVSATSSGALMISENLVVHGQYDGELGFISFTGPNPQSLDNSPSGPADLPSNYGRKIFR